MSIIIAICYRRGSIRLPNKAHLEIAPSVDLVSITLDFAAKLKVFLSRSNIKAYVVVSTDYEESHNVDLHIRRCQDLCTSEASMVDVALDLIKKCNFTASHLLLLQITSPFRKIEDLNIINFKSMDESSAYVSVSKPLQSLNDMVSDEGIHLNKTNLINYKFINGAYYLIPCNLLKSDRTFTPENTLYFETSWKSGIDVDNDYQFELAKALFRYDNDRNKAR